MIREANISDLDDIMLLFNQAIKDLHDKGVDQWQDGYPNATQISEDIKNHQGYVLDEDGIKGYYYLSDYESDYDYIEDGKWLNNDPYLVAHRFVIDLRFRGQDLGLKLMEDLKNKANNLDIRMDTHKDNLAMNHFLVKHGFIKTGIIYLKSGAKRNSYQYIKREK